MSTGSLIGGIVGGAIGFFIGGPMGAIYGASIGFGLGLMVDPLAADRYSAGSPMPQEVLLKSTIGDPCPDLCGTAKIPGHLLAYGAESSQAVYQETTGGGKGGPPEPEPQVTGYKYYMSWQLGICRGPISTLYAIYKNGDLLWEGPLDLPVSGGHETISIEGFGAIDFYFGTDDQIANSGVAGIIADPTLNTPLRNYCWAFMSSCYIGDYPRTPTLEFVISKFPSIPYLVNSIIQEYDCAPLSVAYYALQELSGLPASWFDESDFLSADLALKSEFRGISCLFKDYNSAMTYVQSIMDHADCVLRYGSDGKFHPKLLRDNYNIDTLPVIDENDLLDDIELIRNDWINTKNEIKAQYTEIFNVIREKILVFSNIWGSGVNYNYRMSDLFNFSWEYYSFTESNTTHQYYDKIWKKLSAFTQVLAIDDNNNLWSWGKSYYGETGRGTVSSQEPIGIVEDMQDKIIKYVNALGGQSCVIDDHGYLYSCGWNRYYNLGLYGVTSLERVLNFNKVQTGLGIPDNWLGGSFSHEFGQAIAHNGDIYTVGGQGVNFDAIGWGDDYSRDRRYFQRVPFNNGGFTGGIKCIKNVQTWAEKGSSIYVTGMNTTGVFGLGHSNNLDIFTKIPFTYKQWSTDPDGMVFIGVTSDGTLVGAGYNNYGVLGLGYTSDKVETMTQLASGKWIAAGACSQNVSIALKSDGTVWGAGTVDTNYLGNGLPVGSYLTWTQCNTGGRTFSDLITGASFSLLFKDKY